MELPAFNHPKAMGNDMTAYCGDTALTGNIAAQRALEAADLIVDTMMLLHSPEQEQILKTGTRILLAVEPPGSAGAHAAHRSRQGAGIGGRATAQTGALDSRQIRAGSDFRAAWGNTRQ